LDFCEFQQVVSPPLIWTPIEKEEEVAVEVIAVAATVPMLSWKMTRVGAYSDVLINLLQALRAAKPEYKQCPGPLAAE